MNNVIQSTFKCGSGTTTVATPRLPGESIADLRARHNDRVRDAKANCDSDTTSLPPLQTSWKSELGGESYDMVYASPSGYGKAAHDADVAELQEFYPPS